MGTWATPPEAGARTRPWPHRKASVPTAYGSGPQPFTSGVVLKCGTSAPPETRCGTQGSPPVADAALLYDLVKVNAPSATLVPLHRSPTSAWPFPSTSSQVVWSKTGSAGDEVSSAQSAQPFTVSVT